MCLFFIVGMKEMKDNNERIDIPVCTVSIFLQCCFAQFLVNINNVTSIPSDQFPDL